MYKNSFLKKANIIFSIVAITIAIMIVGCQQEDFEMNSEYFEVPVLKSKTLASDEFEYFGEIVKCQEGELKWKKQLTLIIENNCNKENDLTLENYRYIGKISSIDELEKVKSDIISNSFDICTQNDVPNHLKSVLDDLIPTSKYFVNNKTENFQPFQCLLKLAI